MGVQHVRSEVSMNETPLRLSEGEISLPENFALSPIRNKAFAMRKIPGVGKTREACIAEVIEM